MRERRNRVKPKLLLIPALLAIALVSGCFDYREEIWIFPDMTGTITMDVTIGEVFMSLYEQSGVSADLLTEENIRKKLESFKGISLISINTFTVEDNRRIQLTLKFKSVDALRTVLTSDEVKRVLGDISITSSRGEVQYNRTIALEDSTIAGLAMYDEKRSQRFWVSKVHFPGYIRSTNAPDKNIDEKTRSIIIWGYAIDVLLSEPRSMEAAFTKPSSLHIVPIALAGLVFVAVLFGLYKALGRMDAKPRE